MRRGIVLFGVMGALALVVVAAAVYLASGKVARDAALRDAETRAERIATVVVEPLLPGVLAGGVDARRDLDALIRASTDNDTLSAVLVWREDGTVVYSDEPGLDGRRFPVSGQLAAALDGEVVTDLDPHPEVGGAVQLSGPHVEVYRPLTVPGSDVRYALETYFDISSVDDDAALFRSRILPLVIVALVVLQAAQIPIAVSLARRLDRHESERTQLVQHHLALSDRERRDIAADIHDGPVQDLAGVSYALSAVLPGIPEDQAGKVGRMRDAVRSAIASLRQLMIDIYPDLSGAGLTAAVEHQAERLREQGVTVHVEEEVLPEVSPATAAVLYRAVKECLTNVARHAGARTAWVRLEEAESGGHAGVRLTVSDDGVGFPPRPPGDRRAAPRGRNFGLQFLRDRVVQAQGSFAYRNRPEGGAEIEVLLPADAPAD